MKLKKAVALLCTTGMLMGMLSGCGDSGSGSTSAPGSSNSGSSQDSAADDSGSSQDSADAENSVGGG